MNAKEILKHLAYDPETGLFTRLKNGNQAGCDNGNGYIKISVNGTRYYAHRLAWAVMNGETTAKHIDHINGDRSDNRICNLRECTDSTNRMNTGMWKTNTTGYKGVTYFKSRGKYVAQTTLNCKHKTLGYFDTPEEASAAYQSFVKEHHGEFYREPAV